jgi:predicted MFS family arabinose efflux permease
MSRSANVAAAGGAFLVECLAMQVLVVPYRALLTDVFAPSEYTATSGLQSLFKEIGNLAGFAAGAALLRVDRGYPFLGTAAALLAFTLWPFARMRPHAADPAVEREPVESPKGSSGRRWLYAAQCLWWFAIYVMTAFTVLFVVHVVYDVRDLATGEARSATSHAMWLLVVANVAGLLGAVPAGRLADCVGTRRALMLGIASLWAAAVVALFAREGSFALAVVCCVLYGVGLAAVQVLSYVMLIDMSPGTASSGALAAVFGVLVSVPQIVATASGGFAIDLTHSYRAPFFMGAFALAGAAFCLSRTAKAPARGSER